jgi:hypothetical protein
MVMALLIAILGPISIVTTIIDVLPFIDTPVAGVIGLFGYEPAGMSNRVLLISETRRENHGQRH